MSELAVPKNKWEHHKFESILHTGFFETLNRCAKDSSADFDTP